MTVSTSTAKAGPYAGAGSVGPFTVPFRFLDASHLQVIRTATNGVDSVLVLTTDYTVSGVGLASGSVTLTTALASGEKLTVIRSVPFTQEADYVNNDAFPAESHETALDKLTMQTQQLKERVDAALTLPATADGVSTTLPAPVAGNVIGWDQGGTGLQNYTMPELVSTAVYADWKYKTFVGNGSTVSYVLDTAPGNIANLDVSFDGVTQVPMADFTLSGNVVTFTSAPPNGVNILFRYGSSVAEQTSAFTVERKTATASQTVFTLGNVYVPGANNLAVYVNGLRLSAGDDYIETNSTTVTFTSGLASGDEVTFVVGREISGATGAENVSFLQAGAGAVAIDVQTKLRQVISRSEFSSDAQFNAAKGSKPSIDGLGNFDAKIAPAGEVQGDLSALARAVASGPRDAIVYVNATSVRVARQHVTMGGFRYRGQYTKGRAPTFAMPASKVVSTSTGLGAESAVRTENWYAVFACANSGGTVSLKLMPFLRAGTVSGSNVSLIKAGEAVHALTATTYAWGATNNLAGVECLVITEGGEFSGRVTAITANVAGQVTLASIGTVAAYDFLLPAPPGFEHFCYLGSFYFDTAEVRNIADAGVVVKAKMVNLADPDFTASGAIGAAVRLNFGGYISPLATAVVVKDTHTLSTASTGNHAGYFWHDSSSHTIQENFEQKTSTGNETFVWDGIELPFSQWQDIWYSTGGSLAASRAGATLEVKGWIEP